MYLVSPTEMAEMDSLSILEFGIPGHTLMENAARGAVEVFARNFPNFLIKKICIVCGKGNNGGDGLVMARYLGAKGASIEVFLLGAKESIKGDSGLNLKLLEKTGIIINEILTKEQESLFELRAHKYDIFIDSIFGTGLSSAVKGIAEGVIKTINSSGKPVFAVDIPSGLDSGTGSPTGTAIRADVTATFGYPKIGHAIYPGATFCGKTDIVDIGIPEHIAEKVGPKNILITRKKISSLFDRKEPEAHKGSNGHVLVAGGSPGKSGAAIMTALAALRTGAGLVTLAVPSSLKPFAESSVFEVMAEPLPESDDGCISDISQKALEKLTDGKKVIAIGPGMDKGPGTEAFLIRVIESTDIPMIIDAGALNIIADNPNSLRKLKNPAILTPHPGEMARLTKKTTQEIQENRIAIASSFAKEYGVYLVLKGAATVIASPDGKTFINRTGNPGLATAGTGDVLTGVIAGLAAQGLSTLDAATAGVYIHGKAADILVDSTGQSRFIATDLIKAVPGCMDDLVLNKEMFDFGLIRSMESLF